MTTLYWILIIFLIAVVAMGSFYIVKFYRGKGERKFVGDDGNPFLTYDDDEDSSKFLRSIT
jgi:hypothetical protein